MKEVEDVKNVKDHFLSKSLRALPFAPRGRRLVDETLRDWEHEADAALGAGYAPTIVAILVLAFSVKLRSDSRRSHPDVGVLGGRSVEDGLDERTDRHDAPLMRARPDDRGVDQLLSEPGAA